MVFCVPTKNKQLTNTFTKVLFNITKTFMLCKT